MAGDASAEMVNLLIRYGRVRANAEALRPHLPALRKAKVDFRVWTLLASIDDLLAPDLLDVEGVLWGAAITAPTPEMVRLARAVLARAEETADAG